jgi:hypothetical protein
MSFGAELAEHETGPFGPPDGARARLVDIEQNFVDFANQALLEDLASPPSDRSARLIFGKKGVGKTVYLRRFQANAIREESIYAPRDLDHKVPATEDVIRVSELYPVDLAAEAWQWIWRRAIMRSLVSHLLCEPKLRGRLSADDVEALEGEYRHVVGKFRRPRTVYAEAQSMVAEVTNRDRLARELRHRDWGDVEGLLGDMLVDLPPVCFYLDSVDENFGNAPLYWLQCQKGLCQEVLELYRDRRFGSRLHVVASVRDLVRSSLLRGEHATRFRLASHIRVLDWDHAAIKYFLYEKIRRLSHHFRMKPKDKEEIRGWLGRERIYNPARGVEEDVEDYLLRHTRLIPRDVVQLGNQLCAEVVQAKEDDASELSAEAIRRAVAEVARVFADEQIAVCANHLASDTMPIGAGRHDFSSFYTSAEYSSGVQDELCRFIARVGRDRFSMHELEEAMDAAGGEILRSHPNPLNVLWLNGLLGYDPPEEQQLRSHFYGAHDVADFQLPDDVEWYVFHPIVGHKVRIEAAGERPVRPFH